MLILLLRTTFRSHFLDCNFAMDLLILMFREGIFLRLRELGSWISGSGWQSNSATTPERCPKEAGAFFSGVRLLSSHPRHSKIPWGRPAKRISLFSLQWWMVRFHGGERGTFGGRKSVLVEKHMRQTASQCKTGRGDWMPMAALILPFSSFSLSRFRKRRPLSVI